MAATSVSTFVITATGPKPAALYAITAGGPKPASTWQGTAPLPVPIPLRAATSGSSITAATITVTLPTRAPGDFIVLLVSRNQTGTYTFGTGVTATQIVSNAGRLIAWQIIPDSDAITTFTVTAASAVWTWWCAAYSGVDAAATIATVTGVSANDTGSALPLPTVTLPYIATGDELAVFAAGVNATATWTGGDVFATTSGNAALAVSSSILTAGALTARHAALDRGNDTTTRYESALAFVLQPTGNAPTTNLLANGSFEAGSTIATSWQDESTTVAAPTYSLVTGTTDGDRAQRWQYAGQAGDSAGKAQIFQAPITGANPDDVVTFAVDISGTMTNTYAIVGVEAFAPGGAYISDVSTSITPGEVSATPARFSRTYTVPDGAGYLAVFVQAPAFPATGVIDLTLDRATLVVEPHVATVYPAGGTVAGTSTVSGSASSRLAAGGTVAAVSSATGDATLVTGPQVYPAGGTVVVTSGTTGNATTRLTAGGTTAAATTTTGAAVARLTAGGTVTATTTTTGAATSRLTAGGTTEAASTVIGDATLLALVGGLIELIAIVTGDASIFRVHTLAPLERRVLLEAELRRLTVDHEIRRVPVERESRGVAVDADPRTLTIPAEDRTVHA